MYNVVSNNTKETQKLLIGQRGNDDLCGTEASKRIFAIERGKQMNTIAQTEKGPIEYRVVGQGPAVLVLNGGHTHCTSLLGHQRFFVDHGYQLIIPSRPGYGNTPSSTGRTAEAFADALIALLDQLQLEQLIVLGISAGGCTALQLAGRAPSRVSKLILQNAVTGGKFFCSPDTDDGLSRVQPVGGTMDLDSISVAGEAGTALCTQGNDEESHDPRPQRRR